MYFLQLAVNSLWNLFFFRLNWFGFSAIWLALLVICVAAMIYLFYLNNKKAAYIQIPYLIWTGFAFVLNLSIYYLNL
jgi:tryptophan-rich sensory protein